MCFHIVCQVKQQYPTCVKPCYSAVCSWPSLQGECGTFVIRMGSNVKQKLTHSLSHLCFGWSANRLHCESTTNRGWLWVTCFSINRSRFTDQPKQIWDRELVSFCFIFERHVRLLCRFSWGCWQNLWMHVSDENICQCIPFRLEFR